MPTALVLLCSIGTTDCRHRVSRSDAVAFYVPPVRHGRGRQIPDPQRQVRHGAVSPQERGADYRSRRVVGLSAVCRCWRLLRSVWGFAISCWPRNKRDVPSRFTTARRAWSSLRSSPAKTRKIRGTSDAGQSDLPRDGRREPGDCEAGVYVRLGAFGFEAPTCAIIRSISGLVLIAIIFTPGCAMAYTRNISSANACPTSGTS
jgi:hypothetical protein